MNNLPTSAEEKKAEAVTKNIEEKVSDEELGRALRILLKEFWREI